jgi:hypothetical protein
MGDEAIETLEIIQLIAEGGLLAREEIEIGKSSCCGVDSSACHFTAN